MELDVHTEHCCEFHGCKYGDETCPVAIRLKPQSFPCEECGFEANRVKEIRETSIEFFTMVDGHPVRNRYKIVCEKL